MGAPQIPTTTKHKHFDKIGLKSLIESILLFPLLHHKATTAVGERNEMKESDRNQEREREIVHGRRIRWNSSKSSFFLRSH